MPLASAASQQVPLEPMRPKYPGNLRPHERQHTGRDKADQPRGEPDEPLPAWPEHDPEDRYRPGARRVTQA